jgi:hypothetical protein|tara:strand:- start:852 stop:1109 length:258 start_codon:yes stop_codon:yes gene_type:complete
MKFTTLLAFWFVLVVFGVALAADGKADHSEKYQIDTFKFGDMIDITFLPTTEEYKWNEKYPAKLIFSLCSDVECVTITEEIKIKK